jgi:hypothetical protein
MFVLHLVRAFTKQLVSEFLSGYCPANNMAANCDLTEHPILPSHIAPLGFNESCLCSPDDFREYAPACIDCLFRNDVEATMRDALVKGMNGCVKIIGLPACPKKCSNVPKLMKDCDEEDAAAAAASAAAESSSSALAAASSTAINGPLETGSAAVSAPAAGETSAVKVFVHLISLTVLA